MGRVLSIYLPEWDTQLIQRRGRCAQAELEPTEQLWRDRQHSNHQRAIAPQVKADPQQGWWSRKQPILLTYSHARQELVAKHCRQSHSAGVRADMPVAEATALCPDALVLPFDPVRSRRGLDRLAAWAMRFSPVVEVDTTAGESAPQTCGLLLDITGAAHLFGGEQMMLTEIAMRLRRLGFSSRLAVAPCVGAAWALARFESHALTLVSEDQLPQALRPLPIAALRLPHEIQMQLWQVGIDRLEHLFRIPREQLLVRFGDLVLRRIDQLMGILDERIDPIRTSDPIKFRRAFDGATTQLEAVLLTIQDLLAALTQKLATRESGVRRLTVELSREGDPPVSRDILLGRACRDPKHLWSLMRPKVEGLHLGHGVDAVALTAVWVVPILHNQDGMWEGFGQQCAQDQAMAEFLDTLINRWGTSRVLVAAPVASHIPEESWQFRPAAELEAKAATGLPMMPQVDRPSVLFDRPEPIEVIALFPDNPPSWLRWRGDEHPLTAGVSPERIATSACTRDYFKVKTQAGQWLWIFRQLCDDTWFIHGLWA